jgi:predicted nucleic acid-binding protein
LDLQDMNIVADTSVIIAVITNEPHKQQLIQITRGANLLAPPSLHWEIGNAFSAMLRRQRINLDQALAALGAYAQIPLRFVDISLQNALGLVEQLNVFAYDAYVIGCALQYRCPLVSLDSGLLQAARRAGATIIEVGT